MEPEVRRHRAAIRVSVAEYLPLVTGDRIQLQQVVLNLMLNGIEAMADVADRPRELVVSAEPGELDGRRVVQVAVADAGAGLTAEALERLFEAFYTTKPGGLGMGLSISRSIIESHGGRLWAAQRPGHGATLYFTLPAASDGGA